MLEWLFGKKKEEEPKKSNPSSDQAAEDKWKYDFIVQFLSGPLWKTSILDFVDYHCVVFDNEEENKFEYTTIHNKFKELVASLFDGMMQEVGLDEDKLAELLEKGFTGKHKKIFNQLLLADDFLKFKQLMVNRNKALEAEAVKALHESKILSKPAKKVPLSEEEILRESAIAEQQRIKKLEQEEEEQLRKVLEMSQKEHEEETMIKKLEAKVEEKPEIPPQKEPELPPPKVAEQPPTVVSSPEVEPPAVVPPAEEKVVPMPRGRRRNQQGLEPLPPLRQTRKQEESPPKEEFKPDPPPVIEEKPVGVEQKEMESQEERKRRLMEQREKIRRKKEEERKRQMEQQQQAKGAPVQTIVLQEDGIHDTHIGEQEEKKVNNAELQRRRELMKKIKNRIIDDL